MRPFNRTGFTLIELLVVISIISVLVAILLPALSSARAVAQRTVCASNMRQLVLIVHMYADEYDRRFPYIQTAAEHRWPNVFERAGYTHPGSQCPESQGGGAQDPARITYAYNYAFGNEGGNRHVYFDDYAERNAHKILIFSESFGTYTWLARFGQGVNAGLSYREGGRLSEPHNEGQNNAYLDGRVVYRKVEDMHHTDFDARDLDDR